ncbi:MAG: ImmA/IrrE family metallo-endopeptidase [Candidatus Lokiarchaeota archaeon]|nr:ImmA/IrrE family metallo-endopeptidase [Candidatus Lokiarchaeota archaeon]
MQNEGSSINDFCRYIFDKYEDLHLISEETMAKEFRKFYRLPKIVSLSELYNLCKRLGIKKLEGMDFLTRKLRGFHDRYKKGEYAVYYSNNDWQGAKEHTILHELREIISETFEKIHKGYKKPSNLEFLANEFAAAVLMPQQDFLNAIYETGFDALKIREMFFRSYSSAVLRMASVLYGKQRFIGVLYEKVNPMDHLENNFESKIFGKPQPLETTYVIKKPKIKRGKNNGRILWCMLPRKDRYFEDGSLADECFTQGRSIYRDRVKGFDLFGDDEFSFIARPVIWKSGISKVILIGVPYKDRNLLDKQIQDINPVRSSESFQII